MTVKTKDRQFIYVFDDFVGDAFRHILASGNRLIPHTRLLLWPVPLHCVWVAPAWNSREVCWPRVARAEKRHTRILCLRNSFGQHATGLFPMCRGLGTGSVVNRPFVARAAVLWIFHNCRTHCVMRHFFLTPRTNAHGLARVTGDCCGKLLFLFCVHCIEPCPLARGVAITEKHINVFRK